MEEKMGKGLIETDTIFDLIIKFFKALFGGK